ncbi:MAG: hypothetical protein IIC60_02855 [Proteobacteria bacterium]|nr:hypothetical protein [Pseudomonadota bacterium]
MFQTFLIRNVAGMDRAATGIEFEEKFVHRKLLGTSLEAAGLLTLHLSPSLDSRHRIRCCERWTSFSEQVGSTSEGEPGYRTAEQSRFTRADPFIHI